MAIQSADLSSYNISISTVHLKLHINIAPFPKVLCKYSLPQPFQAAQPSEARQTANKMLKLLRVAARAFTSFKPTFVSSYFSLGPHDIKEFLTKQSLEYRENPTAIRSRYCPFCLKPHNEEPSNLFTLTFRPTSGVFHCFFISQVALQMYVIIDQWKIRLYLSYSTGKQKDQGLN